MAVVKLLFEVSYVSFAYKRDDTLGWLCSEKVLFVIRLESSRTLG